jgi:hypothetical protein
LVQTERAVQLEELVQMEVVDIIATASEQSFSAKKHSQPRPAVSASAAA